MTGYGCGDATRDDHSVSVEIRTLNARGLDVKTWAPRDAALHEPFLVDLVKSRLCRGHVTVRVTLRASDAAVVEPFVNWALARGYAQSLMRLKRDLELAGEITVDTIATQVGVLEPPQTQAAHDVLRSLLKTATDAALDHVLYMRTIEGSALKTEVLRLKREIEHCHSLMVAESQGATKERVAKARARVFELMQDVPVDEARLAQEVAIWAERSDTTEEFARFQSHLHQMESLIASTEPVGRRLDFLLQEMFREANTIGSKCASARIAHLVVDLKSALEKIREQIQNVE